jgi:diguanylate cyclase (GGDEF)-like protein
MSTTTSEPASGKSDRDPLGQHRNRMMYPMAVTGAVFLLPFAANDFIAGRYIPGVAILAVVAAFAIDAWAIRRGKEPPIPFPVLLIPIVAAMGLSLATQGIYGALWSYPAVLFFYFVLPRHLANIGGSALLVAAAIFVNHFFGGETAIRFVFSLALTIIIINIILNVITRLQQDLLDQAVTDPLTGASNRRHMDMALTEMLERNRRTGATASLLVIDIDHFKKINDAYGHDVGDTVLKGMVHLVQRSSRKLDRLFRMGGEEFLLLLPDTRVGDALTRAEKLRVMIAEAGLLKDRQVTVSIGVSEIAGDQCVETWIKRADEALYAAKQGGRNRVVSGNAPVAVPPPAATSDAA